MTCRVCFKIGTSGAGAVAEGAYGAEGILTSAARAAGALIRKSPKSSSVKRAAPPSEQSPSQRQQFLTEWIGLDDLRINPLIFHHGDPSVC